MKTALFVTATTVSAGSIALFLYLSHWKKQLSTKVSHSSTQGTLSPSTAHNITTIPDEIFTPKYHNLYDCASKSISRRHLPDVESSQLLTALLRRNMSAFASLPQAYLLRMMASPEARQSFNPLYIRTLEFKEGDLVCNAYRVVLRTEEKVEFAFAFGTEMGIGGRLVVSLEEDEDEKMLFRNQTVMWREKESKTVLPLERAVPRWMHELTAWWMLDSGVQYLCDQRAQ